LIDIINNITGGIIDFSITDNGNVKCHSNMMDAQAKEIKNKVMCEINSFAIVYFFFDDRLFN
jgi:hypothetical protein